MAGKPAVAKAAPAKAAPAKAAPAKAAPARKAAPTKAAPGGKAVESKWTEVRLQRYLASSGVASRRHSEELITSGHVRVNGKAVTELGTKVRIGKDAVEVDGKRVNPEEHVYYLLNKPKGYVTTVSDPQGRKTVMELLPPKRPESVVPVGRLDFYTEGVILFTNDGELAAGLLHPRLHVEKTYHAKVHGTVTDVQLEKLREGVRIEGRKTSEAKIDRLKFTGTHTWLLMSIQEGRSRQIHKMAEAVGLQVLKLARVAFVGITYYGVKVGACRQLTPAEVLMLKETVRENTKKS